MALAYPPRDKHDMLIVLETAKNNMHPDIINEVIKDWQLSYGFTGIAIKSHPTEEKYPLQTQRFREILDEMYQTHLKKNADYSAMNILGTGEVGLTVRFWDKCARLMNLIGFDIQTGKFTGTKKNLVEDESIVDTVMDAAVYAIIFKIYNEGKWGK